jgi:hypothetical protein
MYLERRIVSRLKQETVNVEMLTVFAYLNSRISKRVISIGA